MITKVKEETEGSKTRSLFKVQTSDGEIFVKVHSIQQKRPFGWIGWNMTGAHCDANFKAIPNEDGFEVQPKDHGWQVVVGPDTPEDVNKLFEAGLLVVVNRVKNAVEHKQTASKRA